MAKAFTTPHSVIEEYIEACRVGSSERLQYIFHPEALMAGYYQGEYYMGSPQPFIDEVSAEPCPADTGAHYHADISDIEVSGNMASGYIKEQGFLGDNYTNWFHLAKLGDEWKIICKSYQDEPAN